MDIEKPKNEVPKIDVEKVLYSKNPGLEKLFRDLLSIYLKRIVHQDDLNSFLETCGHLKDAELIEAGLKFLGIKVPGFRNGKYSPVRQVYFCFQSSAGRA